METKTKKAGVKPKQDQTGKEQPGKQKVEDLKANIKVSFTKGKTIKKIRKKLPVWRIDRAGVEKIIKTGSAKERATLIIHHYNILEGGEYEPILKEEELQALFNTFTTEREINIYNNYRELNKEILQGMNEANYYYLLFTAEWYRHTTIYLLNKYPGTATDKTLKSSYSDLVNRYVKFLNEYTALREYAKRKKYADLLIMSLIDSLNEKDPFKDFREDLIKDDKYMSNLRIILSDFTEDREEVERIIVNKYK